MAVSPSGSLFSTLPHAARHTEKALLSNISFRFYLIPHSLHISAIGIAEGVSIFYHVYKDIEAFPYGIAAISVPVLCNTDYHIER